MIVTIRPTPREDGIALAVWRDQMAALPLDTPDAWTGDTYRAFRALIEEAFTAHGLTHLVGECARDDKALVTFWQELANQRVFNLRAHVQASGWWYDDTRGGPRLKFEWIRWPIGQEPPA